MTETPTAVVFDKERDEVVIVVLSDAGEFEINRVPASESRAANITAAEISTNVTGWSAHTDKSPVPIQIEADDKTVLKRLIDAAAADIGSKDLRYTFSRTPVRNIVLTQAHLSHVTETISNVTEWLKNQQTDLLNDASPAIRLETNARLIARLWLDGPVQRAEWDASSTVVFLSVGTDGSSVGLWSAQSGYVYETEERFRTDASLDQIAWHIHNNLLKLISSSSLNKLSLEPVTHLVLSCAFSKKDESNLEQGEPTLKQELMKLFGEAHDLKSIRLESIILNNQSLDGREHESELDHTTALAMGLLVESSHIPRIDLGTDLETKLTELTEAETTKTTAMRERGRTKAALAIITPFIALAVFLITSWLLRTTELANLTQKKLENQQTLIELKQENSDFESAKANFAVIIGLNDQIATLRDKQAGSYRLMVDLNNRWPQDPTWQIAEVNAKGANVEIKGKTRNEQAITAFTRALENSEGLFSNITVTNNVPNVQTAVVPGAEPSTTNIRDFTVKATYSQLTSTAGAARTPAQLITPQSITPATPSTNPGQGAAPPQALLTDPQKKN